MALNNMDNSKILKCKVCKKKYNQFEIKSYKNEGLICNECLTDYVYQKDTFINLMHKELNRSNKLHGNNSIHSRNEGYGVLMEEFKELGNELRKINNDIEIYSNFMSLDNNSNNDDVLYLLKNINDLVLNAYRELTQLGAMTLKLEDYERKQIEGDNNE